MFMSMPLLLPAIPVIAYWLLGGAVVYGVAREVRKTGEVAVDGLEAINEPIKETTNLALVALAGAGIYFAYQISKKGKS